MACELEMNYKSQYQPKKEKRVAFAVSFEGIATKEKRDARSGAPSRCDDSFFGLLSPLSNFTMILYSTTQERYCFHGTTEWMQCCLLTRKMHIGVGD
jgi:hypothetical protein